MNDNFDPPLSTPVPPPAPTPPSLLGASAEAGLEKLTRELLNDRRSERRWRIFFRLAWLGLALAVAWAIFA